MPRPKGSPKFGGKQKGRLNNATIAKIQEASIRAAEARKLGRKQAVDVLDDLMHTAMGMASKYQPPVKGADPVDETKFKAVMVQTGPTLVTPEDATTIDQGGNILDIDDPKKLARVYASMVRRVG
jgi:hypothetical protein